MNDVQRLLAERDADTVALVISEAMDHLETIEEKILTLEELPDDLEVINDIFRPIHSIKGNAGFIGYGLLNTLSHETETILDHVRKGRLAITIDTINVLLESVDGLKALIAHLAHCSDADGEGPDLAYDIGPVCRKLDAINQAVVTGRAPGPPPAERTRLGEILVDAGVVTQGQIDAAVAQQQRRIGEILVQQGAVSREQVEAAVARHRQRSRGALGEDSRGRPERGAGRAAAAPGAFAPADAGGNTKELRGALQELEVFFLGAQQEEPGADAMARALEQLERLVTALDAREYGELRAAVQGIADDVLAIAESPVPFDGLVAEAIGDRFDAQFNALLAAVASGTGSARHDSRTGDAPGLPAGSAPVAPGEHDLRNVPLGQLLVDEGLVSPEVLERAMAEEAKPLGELLVEQGLVTRDQVDAALERQRSLRAALPGRETIKVNVERLDTLLDLAGQLAIAQTMLATYRAGEERGGDPGAEFDALLARMRALTQDLHAQAMAMRMVPIKPMFQRMQRLVRDLAHEAGKSVDLHVAGEETEIDKTVVEELGDPLVHLIRNALDHGLEGPAEREAAGKPAAGQMWLTASHAEGHLVLEVRDDGRGVDPEAVRAKAAAKGLVAPATHLEEQEIYQLLFAPGFSTAAEVTDLSGRGVGLDVVKQNIQKLRGRVEVSSTAGRGTTFTLTLPLTLAHIDGLVASAGPAQYVIPAAHIVQCTRLAPEDVRTLPGHGEYMAVRDALVPLVRLDALCGATPRPPARSWEALAVVVATGDRQCALVVDDVLGQQEVVVKALGASFGPLGGISGAALLADGRVGLILDVPSLLANAAAARAWEPAA